MFCPNCGAQNQDAATTCSKCGFNLKGSASPKFKGTMLMMNAGGATPGTPGAAPPGAPPPGAPPPGAPAPGGPPGAHPPGAHPPGGGAPMGGGASSDPKPKLKGTMIGVAPPSGGPNPYPMGGPAPGAPMGAPPGGAPMGAPPGGDVNPLGGTMVANAPPAYGGPPMGHPMGAPHDAGPPATMPQAGGPMGSSPGGMAPMGAPGGMAPMGGAPGGMAPMGAPGGMAPMGAPGGMAPMGGAAPMGMAMGGGMAPYAPPAGGGGAMGGKLFPEKSPVAVFFLTLVTCGIYAIFWYGGTKDAMEARGAEVGPLWHIFIPILGLIWVWKWCQGVERVTNGQITATNALIRLWLLGAIGMAWLQSDFNKL